jgi:ATP-dependent Clp protease ATP-binding subunit ClpB
MPAELDQVTRRVLQLEIEEAALKKEKDDASKRRLEALRKELADDKEKADALRTQWKSEKEAIGKLQSLREAIEVAKGEIEKAKRASDLGRAAELQYGKLPALEKQLKDEEQKIAKGAASGVGGARLVTEEVTEDEIGEIVSRWTGIPLTRLLEGERDKLLKLDETLHERVIGQNEAVDAVADAVIRARSGIKDPRRPIGSFIFLGPTGVGKTELAKTLAEALFDTDQNLVRIDMSEYMERHNVSRLIGAPPGYVGYEEGGQLTEAVRRRPYCVILFDEIEKAHGDVFNVLLQILDDGRVTDSQGRTVDFKNTVVIMTSNLGSERLVHGADAHAEIREADREFVMGELRRRFRPEFLNRVDEIVLFKPLAKSEIEKIVDLLLEDLRRRLADRRITIEMTPAARAHAADAGYDPVYGARPLKRWLQREVETRIGRELISGKISDGAAVKIDAKGGELAITAR